jgi:hypothetical protein
MFKFEISFLLNFKQVCTTCDRWGLLLIWTGIVLELFAAEVRDTLMGGWSGL